MQAWLSQTRASWCSAAAVESCSIVAMFFPRRPFLP
jgi:hypothetical protein